MSSATEPITVVEMEHYDNPLNPGDRRTSMEAGQTGPAAAAGEEQEAKKGSTCSIGRIIVALIVVGIVIYVIVDSLTERNVIHLLESFLEWLKGAGFVGIVAFAGVYIVATVAFVPGALLTLGAGFSFSQAYGQAVGIVIGSLVVFVGATIGAILAFLVARYALRDLVSEKARKYRILAAVDKALEGQGLKLVVLLRLSPVIPFNAFNYFMGITGVSLGAYSIGSIGMLPGTVAFVYFGSLVSDIKNAAEGNTEKNPAVQWTVFAVGIVATVAAVVMITIYARRQLQKHLEAVDDEKVKLQSVETPAVGSDA